MSKLLTPSNKPIVTLFAPFLLPGGRAVYPPTFGKGTGAILLDDVACVGNEASLSECSHLISGAHDCSHSEDAGAICVTDGNCEYIIYVLPYNYHVATTAYDA